MSSDELDIAISMETITKRFSGVVANDGIDFDARYGEVHALVGENGAGKSTLMSILAGIYRPDEGRVLVNGDAVQMRSPRDAISHGIGMVFQHFMLVEPFTVAENMALGREGAGTRLDLERIERDVSDLGARFGLGIDPKARIWQLSVGEQQRVEILRALFRGARILVLDEPTAVLTPQESDRLIETLRQMASEGFCVIFISHKLHEVLAVADRVTVLRRGKVVATLEAASTDRHELARLMVGQELATFVETTEGLTESIAQDLPAASDRTVQRSMLSLTDVGSLNDKGLPALDRISFDISSSETLGVAGVAGNGQRELAEVITGLRRATSGRVVIAGRNLTNKSPAEIARAGVAHIPEDRNADGLIPGLDVTANAILRAYQRPPLSRGAFLAPKPVADFTERLIREYDVKTPGRKTRMSLHSGGNQQKLLLARELSGEPSVVVAVHPTRGVDVGATQSIHQILRQQRTRGAAILLISEDLDELLALSDRIAVLFNGRILGIVDAADADREQIGLLMAGIASAPDTIASHV